ncbi:NagB/RpiA/CoA transferase-like superfamily protein [Actinidia rufa]|uniref:NagB/RpiA/CoA transferase-like superfamily protein n=1 Tax=Actinidia rufa TaxID=165716 RepID=A0A7J0FXF5_9ERIC|nr:NagB/RpiA/CoA transferase-like superfamily protein [Actinidia rufa]
MPDAHALVNDFVIQLRKRKIEGSKATAKQAAKLLWSVISQQRMPHINQSGALIDAVKAAVGEQLIAANPVGSEYHTGQGMGFPLARYIPVPLWPLYPHNPEVLLNELKSPSVLLDFGEFSDCIDFGSGAVSPLLHVFNPAFDYVPPELVNLFIPDTPFIHGTTNRHTSSGSSILAMMVPGICVSPVEETLLGKLNNLSQNGNLWSHASH